MSTSWLKLMSLAGEMRNLPVDALPSFCPICREYGTGQPLHAVETGHASSSRRDAIAVFQCHNARCGGAFIAAYAITVANGEEAGILLSHIPLTAGSKHGFSGAIRKVSPTFCETYDQAAQAEENGLTEICGAGFRRALEFLVKDYARSRVAKGDAKTREQIARTQLGQCINEYLPAGPVQEAAKRAAWLGNDETHYYRAWVDHDIQDLKGLISLTVRWVDYMIETDRYMAKMPGPKGKP